jgi:hypothetical protein
MRKAFLLLFVLALTLSYGLAQRPDFQILAAQPGDIAVGVAEQEEKGELQLNTSRNPCKEKTILIFRSPYKKEELHDACGGKKLVQVEQQ